MASILAKKKIIFHLLETCFSATTNKINLGTKLVGHVLCYDLRTVLSLRLQHYYPELRQSGMKYQKQIKMSHQIKIEIYIRK